MPIRLRGRAAPAQAPAPALAAQDVAWLYRELLDRDAGPEEIAHQLAHAATLRDLLVSVLASDERRRHTAEARELRAAASVHRLADGLRALHDTLEPTSLAGRYWVWGGQLLGWAREGRPLSHDAVDADFCVRRDDLPRLEATVGALAAAGFAPRHRFLSNAGQITELTFVRDGAKFEFFVMDPEGDELVYHVYADAAHGAGTPLQAVGAVPAQALVPFAFLDRTWLKHRDHEAELTALYGDWRVPNPAWHYLDDRAIRHREPWRHAADLAWDGAPCTG